MISARNDFCAPLASVTAVTFRTCIHSLCRYSDISNEAASAMADSFISALFSANGARCGYRTLTGRDRLRRSPFPISPHDRHRGGGHPPTPATPPCIRVRTRRFESVTSVPPRTYTFGPTMHPVKPADRLIVSSLQHISDAPLRVRASGLVGPGSSASCRLPGKRHSELPRRA